jgi:ATP-binding cassette, subfamily B, bacterial
MSKKKKQKTITFRDFFEVAKLFKDHLWRYKIQTSIVLLFSGIGSVMMLALMPFYYSKVIDALTEVPPDGVMVAAVMTPFIMLAVVRLSAFVLRRSMAYVLSWLQVRIEKDLSDYSFSKLVNHSDKFFADNFSGSIIAKNNRFTKSFVNLFDNFIFNIWPTTIGILSILIVVYKNNILLGHIFLAWIVVYLLIVFVSIKLRVKYDKKAAAEDSKVTGVLSDVVTNVLSMKIFSSKKTEEKNYKAATRIYEEAQLKAWWMFSHHLNIQLALMIILEIGSMYYTISLWAQGAVTVGFVVLIQGFVMNILGNLKFFGHMLGRMMKSVVDMHEMLEIIELEPGISDPENPETPQMSNGGIEFKNVNFTYDEGQEVFKDFNLKIPAGQKVGLVGHSGSGKTTVTNLMMRFSDVTSGEILIDGQNISAVTQDDLRNNISYVPQEPLLFHRTIQENIAYSKPNATKVEIIDASKKARVDEFVVDLPKGYKTMVGERGVKLSGGQRQRIAIARVMIENAPIFILDEATSALDSESEQCIQESFKEAMQGKTAIVVAHRLSTIQSMDRIIVLDNGKILEDGSHDELLSKKGKYHDLWNHQVNGFITEQ